MWSLILLPTVCAIFKTEQFLHDLPRQVFIGGPIYSAMLGSESKGMHAKLKAPLPVGKCMYQCLIPALNSQPLCSTNKLRPYLSASWAWAWDVAALQTEDTSSKQQPASRQVMQSKETQHSMVRMLVLLDSKITFDLNLANRKTGRITGPQYKPVLGSELEDHPCGGEVCHTVA